MNRSWACSKFLFVVVGVVISSYLADDVFADSNVPSIHLDRTVYPVPFGKTVDFMDVASSFPEGRSLFPLHLSAVVPIGSLNDSTVLGTGEVVLHIQVIDDNFDVSSDNDKLAKDVSDKGIGPLKISLSRDSQTMVLAYAGGDTPNDDGLIDVDNDSSSSTRQLGAIFEINESGVFELDFVVRYTDGPSHKKCPATTTFASLDGNAVFGSEESRFDKPSDEKENYCVMNGDVLTVEYIYVDELGNTGTVTDSAIFDLRNGVLGSDRPVYVIGSEMILTLTDPDLDLDSKIPETYSLDLIEWDSETATLSMGEIGGAVSSFDPEPIHFKETGDDTGVFQTSVTIPQMLYDDSLGRGEEIILEYTDWGPAGAYHVGDEDEDVNLTLFTSNFGTTIDLDKKVYSWNDKVNITVVSPNHNFDSDLVDEIGGSTQYHLKISTRDSSLDDYRLVETGTDTGIFTGSVTLVQNMHDTAMAASGSGPADGVLLSSSDDGITVAFESTMDETVVGSALIDASVPMELSPLKQIKSGVLLADVICYGDLHKMYKRDGSVACVKLDSMSKLAERGWNKF